jgi:hypothetical protein
MKRSFYTPLLLRFLITGSLFLLFTLANANQAGDENTIISNVPLNEINIHAFRHFRKMFPSVSGESWLKMEEGYTVSFIENGRRTLVRFNPKGGFLYSVKYYAGAAIPAETGTQIMKKYPGYHIGVVTEITDGVKTYIQVKIENPSFVKTISVCDGKMELVEDLVNGG